MLEGLRDECNRTYTENGAATFATTQSDCLDLFATIGALRRESEEEIVTRFLRAFAENPDLAMKILFFARDVRGGLGERRVFRAILKWLCRHEEQSVIKNVQYIAEYGRFDDLLTLIGTPCEKAALDVIASQLAADLAALETDGEVSLLAKWLPSVNTSNKEAVRLAKRIARHLKMSDAAYRKTLVCLRSHIRIIENNLREKEYTFDYAKQPAKACFKYRKAFIRNDGARYRDFLRQVSAGDAKLHTGTLTPYEIIAPFFYTKVSEEERRSIDAAWNAQEDFTKGENALVVLDGSGSMYGGAKPLPATVALSLGIYFAEKNKGAFHDHFITFSETPQLVEIKGRDILDKVRYCHRYGEVANTNIQRVFEVVLKAAMKNRVPAREMPQTLYIISDMEFDVCTEDASLTNFAYAKTLFESRGYRLPEVVFWNVASRRRQQPVTQNEQGVALVSGCTPRLFSMLVSGNRTPEEYMLAILGSERYAKIAA